jgi:hypothetical protein
MNILIFLAAAAGLFVAGARLFQTQNPIPYLDSLRQGKNAFLLAGICAGALFPDTEDLYRALDVTRLSFLNLGLIWFGLLIGLECSLRQLRHASWDRIWGQIGSGALISGFAILAILAGGSSLFLRLGLNSNLPLATILCTCFVLTARYPEPTFRWRGRPSPPTPDPTPNLPIHNMMAMVILTICFPISFQGLPIEIGSISFAGGLRVFILVAALGCLAGSCLDFALRAHRRPADGMPIAFCILIFFAGFGHSLGLPPLAIGFIGGVWVINTTVSRRGLLEALAGVDGTMTPLFYGFLGTLIGGFEGGSFFHWSPMVPLIIMIVVVRSMGRTLGFSVSQHLWRVPDTWLATLELSARPLGRLSVAFAVQAFFLLDLAHNTLITGLLGAVVVSQVSLFPPQPQATRAVLTAQKD